MPILFVQVEAVTENEFIVDSKSGVVDFDGNASPCRLI